MSRSVCRAYATDAEVDAAAEEVVKRLSHIRRTNAKEIARILMDAGLCARCAKRAAAEMAAAAKRGEAAIAAEVDAEWARKPVAAKEEA